MACDTYRRPQQTLAERNAEIARALKRLEQQLLARAVKIAISAQGAIAFAGWGDGERAGLSDACTYRLLQVQGSYALREAIAKAEAMQGRKVNARAIAAGVHSHDGGNTWGPGHGQ